MSASDRPQKITFAEMRDKSVRDRCRLAAVAARVTSVVLCVEGGISISAVVR